MSQQDTSNNGALVVSGPPKAMNESAYQEMGTTEIHNFGGDGYADFREAHTTNMLVDPNHKPRKSFKSLKDLEKEPRLSFNVTKIFCKFCKFFYLLMTK